MKRHKVPILIALAIAVIVFDVWFFLGDADDSVDLAADGESSWSPSDLLSFATGRDESAPSVAPWSDPASWPMAHRRTPLDGTLDRELMTAAPAVVVPVAAQADGPVFQDLAGSLPRLSVVLWDRVAPVAVLDTRVVRVGDLHDGFRIERIAPDEVQVRRYGVSHVLPLVAAHDASSTNLEGSIPSDEAQ